MSQTLPARDAPFNFAALVGDVSCFLVGMAFLDTSTALPALVTKLGGTPTVLAALAALRQAAYYLPQLVVAHRLQNRTRFQPFLLKVCGFGRIWLFVAAIVIFLVGRTLPGLALAALVVAYTLSWLGDGMGGVPWTAIVGRAVPLERRGRLFATIQVISGVGRFGVGAAVTAILSEKYFAFPASGGLLVLGCAVFLLLSWIFLALIREPAPQKPLIEDEALATEAALGFVGYLRALPVHFRARPDVAMLALVQVLTTAASSSAPFLLGHASRHTTGGLPLSIAGTFLMVQTGGLLLLAPVLGGITDRIGPRRTLIVLLWLSLGCTATAVVGGLRFGAPLALPLFFAAYFCLGAASDAWTTITNYLLEAVPDQKQQATFVAILNASTAPALLLPLGLGLLVSSNGSATGAFGAASLLLLAGLIAAHRLPDTRQNTAISSF
ncbi:MAG: hypothetical protein H7Z41_12215 [Cytophagales bacterium]|nr:hypothetical protein [Armatimonadota bacterium]